jgi:hypothetical protein
LYSFIAPLFVPNTLATPLAKPSEVDPPKAMAAPELFVTVGVFAPIELAPANVIP